MRYPKPLEQNGVIGLIAPSFGAATQPYITGLDEAEKAWKSLGYRPHEYGCARKAEGIGISSLPEVCAQEVNQAFSDDVTDVLISVGGGELMCEVMSYVDFDLLKKEEPKWFMGYSDNTKIGRASCRERV